MLANYGYTDASGEYYITINTDVCVDCAEKKCVQLCPAQLFAVEVDDYDDEVAVIKESLRNTLKAQCAACKPLEGRPDVLPCQSGCPGQAVTHSW